MVRPFVALLARIVWWNTLPNSHYATFYNFSGGSRVTSRAFRRRLREDLTALFDLLVRGAITPSIAARFALADISAALVLAESRTVQGKVVLCHWRRRLSPVSQTLRLVHLGNANFSRPRHLRPLKTPPSAKP